MNKDEEKKEQQKYFSLIENGTITDVPEFFAAAVHSGVRRSKKDDLSIIYTPLDTTSSGIFTKNKFAAAPVIINKKQLSKSRNIKAIVINTGIANACTGKQGIEDAEEIIQETARLLKLKEENVAIASTGLIGKQLPLEKILNGVEALSKMMDLGDGHRAARSILTIDKNTKEIAVRINTKKFFNTKKDIVIGAIGKGSIMVAPNMGTILCFIATNIKINQNLLDEVLFEGIEHSFNAISIDGCQSTNDMVFIQNNSESELKISKKNTELLDIFKSALFFVLEEMAKKVILDGEGASKFVEIEVKSSRDKAEAKEIGMKIANSILVKASIFGETINWGRIASAIGSTNFEFNVNEVEIFINGFLIFKNGMEVSENIETALPSMKEKYIRIKVCMHTGTQNSFVWTTDLTHDFVKASSHYRS